MSELDDFILQRKAVEFALMSFADYSSDEERMKYLRDQFTNIPYLKLYFELSKVELNAKLDKLHDLRIAFQLERRQGK